MLAVAGAGKTYHICHTIQPDKKNLILAYTHSNIRNIKRELVEAFGAVPELTRVMTFDSFVYRFLIRPYEPTILNHFHQSVFSSTGVTLSDPPAQRIKTKNGKVIPNPRYITQDKFEHYINKYNQYYCSLMTKLLFQVKQGKTSLIEKAATTLNCFYDQIMIDEFQDFREYDYEFIVKLAKYIDNISLVGDYYQHSVSAVNNSGKPFKKGSGYVDYDEFKELLLSQRFEVDDILLRSSRRCCQDVCSYVKDKLMIDIESSNVANGKVVWIEDELPSILDNDRIPKLVFNDANSYTFHAINWSYSKGDTMEDVCVILTDKLDSIDKDDFSRHDISPITLNKLYVAMTRTKGNLYLVKSKAFKTVKHRYLLKNNP